MDHDDDDSEPRDRTDVLPYTGELPLGLAELGAGDWNQVDELSFGRACLAACTKHVACLHVSFALALRSCAWFAACDTSGLQHSARQLDWYTASLPISSGCVASKPLFTEQVLALERRADSGGSQEALERRKV